MGVGCFDLSNVKRKEIILNESKETIKFYINENNEIYENTKQIKKQKIINTKNYFLYIKSKYLLINIFSFLKIIKRLKIMKYNKKLQKRLEIKKDDYKKYSRIEIEIIPLEYKYGTFINIQKYKDRPYFHIYFNDNKKEEKRNFFKNNEKIDKIKIIIDHNVESFAGLFHNCAIVKTIYFKYFYRNNINNMSNMFFGCSSLKYLDLSNFNTDNVIYMNNMFYQCSLLKELNLSKFNTEKVINMSSMFNGCSSLKKLNISNITTNNVVDITEMFKNCYSLEELDLTNFNFNNIEYMNSILDNCFSLKIIKFPQKSINK